MKLKHLNTQSGFTLVELLAAITISTMLIGLLWGALTMAFKHTETTQSHINLRQEANLMVTKLRQKHHQQNYTLCYREKNLYFDSDSGNPLTSEEISLRATDNHDRLIKNGSVEIKESNTDQCFTIDPSHPLTVSLTLENPNDNTFEIDTVIDRLGAYNEGADHEPDNDGADDQGNVGFNSREDFEEKIQLNTEDFKTVEKLESHEADVRGNVSFNKSNLKAIYRGTPPRQTHIVGGSAYFSEGLRLPSEQELVVDRDLFVGDSAHLMQNAKLNVKENALIDGGLTLNGSMISVEQNVFIKEELSLTSNQAHALVLGSARIDQGISIKDGSTAVIEHHLFTSNNIELKGGSKLIVNRDAYLETGTNFTSSNHSEFVVEGVVHIGEKEYRSNFTYNGHEIIVKGH